MLTKEVVVEYSTEYLKLNGYSINLDDETSDLVAFKENEFLRVIALGNVSDAGGTNKKGRGFNKNQVRTNLALALFEVSRQITINEKVYEYVIVIPDSKIYLKQLREIISGIEILNIKVLITTSGGLIKEY